MWASFTIVVSYAGIINSQQMNLFSYTQVRSSFLSLYPHHLPWHFYLASSLYQKAKDIGVREKWWQQQQHHQN